MPTDLRVIDQKISSAWAALCGARAAAFRSPTGHTIAVEDQCERAVNALLEQRLRMSQVAERARA